MAQKPLSKKASSGTTAAKRKNAPKKPTTPLNPASKKLRPGVKPVGIKAIEGQLAGIAAGNNEYTKLVKPGEGTISNKKRKTV